MHSITAQMGALITDVDAVLISHCFPYTGENMQGEMLREFNIGLVYYGPHCSCSAAPCTAKFLIWNRHVLLRHADSRLGPIAFVPRMLSRDGVHGITNKNLGCMGLAIRTCH